MITETCATDYFHLFYPSSSLLLLVDMIMNCVVCKTRGIPSDPLLVCLCGLSVHPSCSLHLNPAPSPSLTVDLTTDRQEPTSSWHCDICTFASQSHSPPTCLICHSQSPFLRFSTPPSSRYWYHPLCVVSTDCTTLSIGSLGKVVLVVNKGKMKACSTTSSSEEGSECILCNKIQGVTRKCGLDGCEKRVHVRCAVEDTQLFSVDVEGGNISLVCREHHKSPPKVSILQWFGKDKNTSKSKIDPSIALWKSIRTLLSEETERLSLLRVKPKKSKGKPLHPFFSGKSKAQSHDRPVDHTPSLASTDTGTPDNRKKHKSQPQPIPLSIPTPTHISISEHMMDKEPTPPPSDEGYILQGSIPPIPTHHIGYTFIGDPHPYPLTSSVSCRQCTPVGTISLSLAYSHGFEYKCKRGTPIIIDEEEDDNEDMGVPIGLTPVDISVSVIIQRLSERYAISTDQLHKLYSRLQSREPTQGTWPVKYSPDSFKEYTQGKPLRNWLREFSQAYNDYDSELDEEDQPQNSSCVVLRGPSSSGKTSLVYTIAKQMGYNLIEVNSTTHRTRKYLLTDLAEATQSKSVSKGLGNNLLLLEDLDHVYPDEQGLPLCIQTMVQASRCPIVVVCSSVLEGYSGLTEIVLETECLSEGLAVSLLCLVGLLETCGRDVQVEVQVEEVRELYMTCSRDIRRALVQMEFWCRSGCNSNSTTNSNGNSNSGHKGGVTMEDSSTIDLSSDSMTDNSNIGIGIGIDRNHPFLARMNMSVFSEQLQQRDSTDYSIDRSGRMYEMAEEEGIELLFQNYLLDMNSQSIETLGGIADTLSLVDISLLGHSPGVEQYRGYIQALCSSSLSHSFSTRESDTQLHLGDNINTSLRLHSSICSDLITRKISATASLLAEETLYRTAYMRLFYLLSHDGDSYNTGRRSRRRTSTRYHYLGRCLSFETIKMLK